MSDMEECRVCGNPVVLTGYPRWIPGGAASSAKNVTAASHAMEDAK